MQPLEVAGFKSETWAERPLLAQVWVSLSHCHSWGDSLSVALGKLPWTVRQAMYDQRTWEGQSCVLSFNYCA